MKISKLFHWLYALLMLLPAFFVGGRMAYTIFNKNAKDSYTGTKVNASDFVQVSFDDLVVNKTYRVSMINTDDSMTTTRIYVSNFKNYTLNIEYNEVTEMVLYKTSASYIVGLVNGVYSYFINGNMVEFTFVGYNVKGTSINYANFEEVFFNDNYYLDNAFDYSMAQLNELPLFSWAKDSFIVEPFQYITGLFGVPANSPISTLLSYWCAISIIWLVFDLLMYVPLLVHRWIDKGVLE